MREILIAGFGHGGIIAGIMLARQGYGVTVLEKGKKSEMGWDWHDMMLLSVFDRAGIKRPDEKYISPALPMAYHSPNKKTVINTEAIANPDCVYIDRKGLSAHLIREAEDSGVRILFETEILSAVVENKKVVGVTARNKGKIRRYTGDLVIDAAGMDSPVRKSLPQVCGIRNIITDEETFFVYRAYFERPEGLKDKAPYSVYLFHCGNKGMDWAITDEKFVDILIGSFGKIDEKIINSALEDFKREFELEGKKIIRGGVAAKIPLRNTLPLFVADGYAAVGDSACMTEPMSGSGITLSMEAGIILAETVTETGNEEFTAERLWKYNYTYLRDLGMRYMGDENLRKTLQKLSVGDVNYFINTGIIGANELKGGGIKINSPKEAVDLLAKFLPKAYILPVIAQIPIKNAKADKIKNLLPEQYDREKINAWVKLYSGL